MIQFFADVETTGLDPATCSIFQLAGIVVDSSGVREEFNFKIRPYRDETITEEAFLKTGVSQQELETYPDVREVFPQIIALLDRHNIGRSYNEKAHFIGYNSTFDMSFCRSLFEFCGDLKFGYRFWWPSIDVAVLSAAYLAGQRPNMRGFKLVDVYKFLFGETFNGAHDALADIRATERVLNYLVREAFRLPDFEKDIPIRGTR